jgi:hypothetical protein
LETDPSVLEAARERVLKWRSEPGPRKFYVEQWSCILEQPLVEIAAFLCDEGERARELRQSSPFAGAISSRERWRIWREVGDRSAAER